MDRYRGTLIKPLRLHPDAVALLPPAGQRRDILLKTLRRIQVTPSESSDFRWEDTSIQVTCSVGYSISWLERAQHILILDLRQQ
ncbi:hypothetical protein [Rubritalea tangerina]|uniref:Uncharacterized protein n=1 Tax=Rubritalea tangerina TaxID=430798 RepID=A0ABW4Z5N8_9BACT